MPNHTWALSPDRCFDAEPTQRALARELYAAVKDQPLISPHGHVSPALLADPNARFGSPADLFIIPDHYVVRMLYSQGVRMEDLGVPARDGAPVETDHRRIWQRFADHFYLFRGTPSGLWLTDELINVFGVDEPLNGDSAQRIYNQLEAQLARPEFTPRALFERFRIELLSTTDSATDPLDQHRRLHAEGFRQVRPTFRPDAVVNLHLPAWREQIAALSAVADVDVVDYASYLRALETRRAAFKQLGGFATDHAALTAHTERLSQREAESIFGHALQGRASAEDGARFTAHMLIEFARMSVEDGLVMQLHVGSFRNHNQAVFDRFGPDTGADMPIRTDWTNGLHALLNAYGSDPRLRLILFTLDEGAYSRELAPLAGHYPALRLGPPWWFFDSVNGMRRFLDLVVETAGVYNTAGFNDDTRAFASIPARHDVWRRVTCNWLAGQVVQGLIEEDAAHELAGEFAYGLARRAYKLDQAAERGRS
jgi:glucuronate isomerase